MKVSTLNYSNFNNDDYKKKDSTEFSVNKNQDENYIGIDTQITLNLFENLKYDLKSIRLGQSVKPIYLTKLPKDLKKIKSTNKRKETFIFADCGVVINPSVEDLANSAIVCVMTGLVS